MSPPRIERDILNGPAPVAMRLSCPNCGNRLHLAYTSAGKASLAATCRSCDWSMQWCGVRRPPPWVQELGESFDTIPPAAPARRSAPIPRAETRLRPMSLRDRRELTVVIAIANAAAPLVRIQRCPSCSGPIRLTYSRKDGAVNACCPLCGWSAFRRIEHVPPWTRQLGNQADTSPV